MQGGPSSLHLKVSITIMNAFRGVTRQRFANFSTDTRVRQQAISGVAQAVKIERISVSLLVTSFLRAPARHLFPHSSFGQQRGELAAQGLALAIL